MVLTTVMSTQTALFDAYAATIKISKTKVTLNKGASTTLKITGTKSKVSWSSSKSSVVTVSKAGKITAKKVGTATITAKVSKKKLTCKVTVKDPVGSRTNPANLRNGATIPLFYGTAYVKLDKTLKGEAAISQLQNMGEWDEYAEMDYADHPNTQLVYFEYTLRASGGFTKYPLSGLDIINSYGLYNASCSMNINSIDALYLSNSYANKDNTALTLYSGSTSKMYMVLYVPSGINAFSYPIYKKDFSQYWTKYTF